MPSSPPEPIFIFQQSEGKAVSSVSFVHLFDKNYLLSCSVDFCQLFDLKTLKNTSKIPLHFGEANSSADSSGKSVLACGQWLKNRGIWANVRCSGVKFFLLEMEHRNLRAKKEIVIENPNFVGFCGATVALRREKYIACVPYENEIKIFCVDDDGFLEISALDSAAKSKGMPMCLKSHYVDSQDKLLLLIGYENGDLRLIQCVFGQPQSIYIEQSVKLHDQPVIDIDYFTISNVSEYMIKGYCVSVNDKLSNFVVDRDFRLVDCTNNTTNTYLKQLPYSSCTTVRVRQDGKFFVVGFWNGKMYVYSAKSYKLLCILNSGDVTCASFANPQDCHGTDRYLACGSASSAIYLWNLYK